MLEELLLQGMQLLALGHTLDRLDRLAVGLDAEHQARAHQTAIEQDAACAAVAG